MTSDLIDFSDIDGLDPLMCIQQPDDKHLSFTLMHSSDHVNGVVIDDYVVTDGVRSRLVERPLGMRTITLSGGTHAIVVRRTMRFGFAPENSIIKVYYRTSCDQHELRRRIISELK